MDKLWQVKGLTGAIAVRKVNENIWKSLKTHKIYTIQMET